ncbi:MAG: Thioredoxin [Chlamydiae bacterium]|nr:Thioredoxin [Chlamydiota bacterium]
MTLLKKVEIWMTSDLIRKVSSADFKDTIQSGLTLVDFFAEWCAPCRMLVPVLEEIAEEKKGALKLCKVDIDQAQDITNEFQVTSVPTLILFKDGKEVNRTIGLKGADELRELISQSS